MKKFCLAIDFDGVIHKYGGWQGGLLQDPIRGAKEFIEGFLKSGMEVVIFSTRDPEVIRGWLFLHKFPILRITNIKEQHFDVFLDDRAINFSGEFTAALFNKVRNYKPYWKSQQEEER